MKNTWQIWYNHSFATKQWCNFISKWLVPFKWILIIIWLISAAILFIPTLILFGVLYLISFFIWFFSLGHIELRNATSTLLSMWIHSKYNIQF